MAETRGSQNELMGCGLICRLCHFGRPDSQHSRQASADAFRQCNQSSLRSRCCATPDQSNCIPLDSRRNQGVRVVLRSLYIVSLGLIQFLHNTVQGGHLAAILAISNSDDSDGICFVARECNGRALIRREFWARSLGPHKAQVGPRITEERATSSLQYTYLFNSAIRLRWDATAQNQWLQHHLCFDHIPVLCVTMRSCFGCIFYE